MSSHAYNYGRNNDESVNEGKYISRVHNVQDINGEIMFNNDLLMDSDHKTLRQSPIVCENKNKK